MGWLHAMLVLGNHWRNEFAEKNVLAHNHTIGNKVHTLAAKTIAAKGLSEFVSVGDTDWWPIFTFKDKEQKVSLAMKTLMMQEMIDRGILFNGFFVPCFSHTESDVEFFITALNESLSVYADALDSGYEKFLNGPVIKPVFRKYL